MAMLTDIQPVSDPMSTFRTALVTKPSTPVLPRSASWRKNFAKQLADALDRVCWRQNLRRQLYGEDTANMFPIGYTPPDVKACAIPATSDDDSTTTDEDAPQFDIWRHAPDKCWRRQPGVNHGQIKQNSDKSQFVKQLRGASIVSRLPNILQVESREFGWLAGKKRKMEEREHIQDSAGGHRSTKKRNMVARSRTKERGKSVHST